VQDLRPLIAGSTGVVAGGRSALESLAAEKPVIALGEKGVVGLCAEDTWADAMRTNFGDHFETGSDQFYPAKLEIGLRRLLAGGPAMADLGRWGRAQVEKPYAIQIVARDIEQVYQACISRS
jgi:hypothetical protein